MAPLGASRKTSKARDLPLTLCQGGQRIFRDRHAILQSSYYARPISALAVRAKANGGYCCWTVVFVTDEATVRERHVTYSLDAAPGSQPSFASALLGEPGEVIEDGRDEIGGFGGQGAQNERSPGKPLLKMREVRGNL